MPIVQRNPLTGAPTGVVHPDRGESRHFVPTHGSARRRRQAGDPMFAPEGQDPMVCAQNSNYFADSFGPNARRG